MIKATTPLITLTVGDSQTVNFATANNIYVSFEQRNVKFLLEDSDLIIEGNKIKFRLTQEQSLQLSPSHSAEIQVNWTYFDDNQMLHRAATKVKSISVGKQLLNEVIS